MKVLWFANTACSATKKLGLPAFSGGWLSSLELALNKQPGIELAICFYTTKEIVPFEYNGTRFYPVCREAKTSKLSRWLTKLSGNVLKGDAKELEKLKQVVMNFQPDIIHVHGTEENFGLLTQHGKVPLVISLQGVLTAYAACYFNGIPLSVCNAHERLSNRLSLDTFKAKYKVFLQKAERERTMLRDVKHIFGRTDWDKNQASLLAPNAKYHVSNEILRPAFYEAEPKRHAFKQPLQIITTAGDSLYKGFETIVDACEYLKQHQIEFEWKVIGLSSASETVKLVSKWKKIDNLNIRFCGQKSDEEIASMMQASDIYVQCSHIENSPNSLCEAMLMGMPIVASAAGGTASLADHNKEALLYEPGDAKTLVEHVLYLKNNEAAAESIRAAARKKALLRHDKTNIVNELIGAYKAIIEQ